VLIWNRGHLHRVLGRYLRHYNTIRPHRGLELTAPLATTSPPPASVTQLRRVERNDILGGLIHEYRHAA
jgi:hypothetical protein